MNRLSAKLLPSRGFWQRLDQESGSAVAEFALIAVPLCLLFAAAMAFCINVYVDSTMRYEAIATARFAALADVSLGEARTKASEKCAQFSSLVTPRCEVEWQASAAAALSEYSYQPIGLLFFEAKRVVINASTPLEISK